MNLTIKKLRVDAGGEGSRGGHIIGHTGSGKPVYSKSGLPARTGATMGEAIAMSSPSGRMSKRSKEAATKRLSTALFGEGGLEAPKMKQPSAKTSDLRRAKEMHSLADAGMGPRKHRKAAEELEKKHGVKRGEY